MKLKRWLGGKRLDKAARAAQRAATPKSCYSRIKFPIFWGFGLGFGSEIGIGTDFSRIYCGAAGDCSIRSKASYPPWLQKYISSFFAVVYYLLPLVPCSLSAFGTKHIDSCIAGSRLWAPPRPQPLRHFPAVRSKSL